MKRFFAMGVVAMAAALAGGAFAGSGRDTMRKIAGSNNSRFSAEALAVDGKGNVYFYDGRAAVVRKVSSCGTITAFAGQNRDKISGGSLGDGGPATAANLLFSHGLAVDGQGNLYIAQGGRAVVRKVRTDGTITTFAGTDSTRGSSGG